MEVLNKSHFSLQMGICPVPVAEHSGINLLKKFIKNQKASYNFKLGFALSKRPHFNSIYLVRVPFLTGIAVILLVFYHHSRLPSGLRYEEENASKLL